MSPEGARLQRQLMLPASCLPLCTDVSRYNMPGAAFFPSPPALQTARRARRKRHRPPPLSQRRAPRTFVRLHPGQHNTTLLQTSTTTFTSLTANPHTPSTLHLHALLHIADPPYYTALHTALSHTSASPTGFVLHELITPAALSRPAYPGLRTLHTRVRATSRVAASARSLGAVAQADALDPRARRWYVADLPAEAVSGLQRGAHAPEPRLAPLRVAAALLPCPELFAAARDLQPLAGGALGEVAAALARFDVAAARRRAFARLVVASSRERVYAAADEVSAARDAAAVAGVKAAVAAGAGEVAVVYGAWHAGRLCRWVEDELGMGFVGVQWRTAMVLPGGGGGTGALVSGAAFAVAYFCYAGVDWVATLEGVVKAAEGGLNESVVAEVLRMLGWYAIRHLVPYVGFCRWFGIDDGV